MQSGVRGHAIATNGGPGIATVDLSLFIYKVGIAESGRVSVAAGIIALAIGLISTSLWLRVTQSSASEIGSVASIGGGGWVGTLIGRTLLTLVMAVWIAPIYWLVNTAFKEKVQIQSPAPVWFPSPITFDNMQWVYENLDPAAFARSLRVVAISVGVSLIMGPIMAYALSRFQMGIWRRLVC